VRIHLYFTVTFGDDQVRETSRTAVYRAVHVDHSAVPVTFDAPTVQDARGTTRRMASGHDTTTVYGTPDTARTAGNSTAREYRSAPIVVL
jgi:hypothetical protein